MKKWVFFTIEGFIFLCILTLFSNDVSQELALTDRILVAMFFIAVMITVRNYYKHKNKPKNEFNKEQDITYDPQCEILLPSSNNKHEFLMYSKRPFLTPNELSFYNRIKELNNEYIVIPQVNLGAIINKFDSKYRNELFRNIDFGIFTKDFELLLLIELNDSSHNSYDRRDRDLKVKKILNDCQIKLIVFYTKYPNEKNYVLNRIRNEINSDYIKDDLDIML